MLLQIHCSSCSALNKIHGKRTIVISRSTFPSTGRYSGHWLGDNNAQWADLDYSMSGWLTYSLTSIFFPCLQAALYTHYKIDKISRFVSVNIKILRIDSSTEVSVVFRYHHNRLQNISSCSSAFLKLDLIFTISNVAAKTLAW